MEKMASVIFECQFDEDTIKSMVELRSIRLAVAKQQLANTRQTVATLIHQNLLEEGERHAYGESLQALLKDKIAAFEVRARATTDTIYADEIEIYLELLGEKA